MTAVMVVVRRSDGDGCGDNCDSGGVVMIMIVVVLALYGATLIIVTLLL